MTKYVSVERIENGYVVGVDQEETFCKTLAKVNKLLKAIFTAAPAPVDGNVKLF